MSDVMRDNIQWWSYSVLIAVVVLLVFFIGKYNPRARSVACAVGVCGIIAHGYFFPVGAEIVAAMTVLSGVACLLVDRWTTESKTATC